MANGPLSSAADVALYFYHPALDAYPPPSKDSGTPPHTLVVHTGANDITWSYKLNTKKIPTYAGEVVQILSAQIGELTISGNTRNKMDLAAIYKWFRAYMTLAGTNQHTQTPVKFQYPERGWELGIYIKTAPEFRLARDQVIGEWKITAEINQDDKPILEDVVMQPLNYAMPRALANMGANAILPRGIGFTRRNRFSEYLPPNTALPDDKLNQWFSDQSKITGNNIGKNFQALIASWAGGDFAHFVFDTTQTTAVNGLSDPDTIWRKLFGTTFTDGSSDTQPQTTGGSSTGDTTSLSSKTGTLTAEEVAAVMVAAGFPKDENVLTEGIATSWGESSWVIKSTHTNSDGSIDRGLFQINSVHAQYDATKLLSDPVYNAKAALAIWSGAGNTFATQWYAHGGPAYLAVLDQGRAAAKRYLANPTAYDGSGGGTVADTGSFAYPLGNRGTIGQRPNAPGGTHSPPGGPPNWESCNAIDISIPFGTNVIAVTDGTIGSQIGMLPGTGDVTPRIKGDPAFSGQFGGMRVHLEGGTNAWYYAHLSAITVSAGQVVRKGQVIGRSGEANGVEHLHFAQKAGDPGVTVGSPSPGYRDIYTAD